MKFMLIRHQTDEGTGLFAAFARHERGVVELPLGSGDLYGDLTPAVLRTWAWAAIAHLFGGTLADRHADALAASELVAPELRQPVDWSGGEYLYLPQSDVVRFVLGAAA